MKVVSFTSLISWVKANRIMLTNAGSLVASTGVTSVLGFAYWWLAARRFPPEAVGIASTSTSAMMLIGGLCTLGFSTLLLTELPRKPELTGQLISTALLAVGCVAAVVSLVFAYIAPYISPQYRPLQANPTDVIILVVGIALSAMTLVFDQAMIGILHGELQFWRNVFFSGAKLLGLFVIGIWFSRQDGMRIYAAWAYGSLLSMVVIMVYASYKKVLPLKKLFPQISLLKKLGLPAFQHHLLNTMLQVPMQVLPLIVTALLSAQVTAWFFTSWQLANFVFLIPSALTTVLHAMNSAQPAVLARKARSTISIAVIIAVLVDLVLLFETKLVLSPFGASYAAQAEWSLRILSLAAFPLIVKSHYISICRIHDRIIPALYSMIPGSILEVIAAAVGAHFWGLTGLSAGWVIAVSVESLFMISTVYKAVWPSKKELAATFASTDMQPIWLMDTVTVPALSVLKLPEQGYSSLEDIWRTETVTMPSITEAIKKNVVETNYQGMNSYYDTPSEKEGLENQKRNIQPKLGLPGFNGSRDRTQQSRLQRYRLVEHADVSSYEGVPTIVLTTDPLLQSQRRSKNDLAREYTSPHDEGEPVEVDQLDTIKTKQSYIDL